MRMPILKLNATSQSLLFALYGWAEQQWRAWVIETLSEALFGRPAAG